MNPYNEFNFMVGEKYENEKGKRREWEKTQQEEKATAAKQTTRKAKASKSGKKKPSPK